MRLTIRSLNFVKCSEISAVCYLIYYREFLENKRTLIHLESRPFFSPYIAPNQSGETVTFSISSTFKPKRYSIKRSHNRSPSISSTGGAPSLVASSFALDVKVPVVTIIPLLLRPSIAPRKSRAILGPTGACCRFH